MDLSREELTRLGVAIDRVIRADGVDAARVYLPLFERLESEARRLDTAPMRIDEPPQEEPSP